MSDSSVANHHEARERLELCPHILGHALGEYPIAMFRHRIDAEEYLNLLIRAQPGDAKLFYIDSPNDG